MCAEKKCLKNCKKRSESGSFCLEARDEVARKEDPLPAQPPRSARCQQDPKAPFQRPGERHQPDSNGCDGQQEPLPATAKRHIEPAKQPVHGLFALPGEGNPYGENRQRPAESRAVHFFAAALAVARDADFYQEENGEVDVEVKPLAAGGAVAGGWCFFAHGNLMPTFKRKVFP